MPLKRHITESKAEVAMVMTMERMERRERGMGERDNTVRIEIGNREIEKEENTEKEVKEETEIGIGIESLGNEEKAEREERGGATEKELSLLNTHPSPTSIWTQTFLIW